MKVPNDPLSWLNRGLKINDELRQFSPERVEEILCIISLIQNYEKLKDDETKGYLTPKDSEDLKQLRNAKDNYDKLLKQIEGLNTSQ